MRNTLNENICRPVPAPSVSRHSQFTRRLSMTTRPKASSIAPGISQAGVRRLVNAFIGRFEPRIAKIARSSLAILRRRFSTAVELVYDNYNALAIGWSPNERASEVIVSLALYARGVTLYFTHGKKLADPKGLLQGSGNQGRFLRVETPAMLNAPAPRQFLKAATALSATPLPKRGRGYIVIKSISAKQRPRRPIPRKTKKSR